MTEELEKQLLKEASKIVRLKDLTQLDILFKVKDNFTLGIGFIIKDPLLFIRYVIRIPYFI